MTGARQTVPADHQATIGRQRKRRSIAIAAASAILSLALAVLGAAFAPSWLIAAALGVLAVALLPLGIDWLLTPRPFRQLSVSLRDTESKAKTHPLLEQYYNDTIDQTRNELDSIHRGRFEFKVADVPPMSSYAVGLIDSKCTLMFPMERRRLEDIIIADNAGSKNYYEQICQASKRLIASGKDPVRRIFMFDRSEGEIQLETLAFIEQNLKDGIDVRILDKARMPTATGPIEWEDFGYYETSTHRWVMMVRQPRESHSQSLTDYVVETDPKVVERYRVHSEAISAASIQPQEFISDLRAPINSHIWPVFFAEEGYEMTPPHGLSSADAEAITNSVIAMAPETTADGSVKVLILGFTPKLVRSLSALRQVHISSIDAIAVKPTDAFPHVRYMTGNWLDIDAEDEYDAIIFDESINNLNSLQNQMLFPVLARALRPGGHIIGRVFGQFDDQVTAMYRVKTPDEALQELKAIDGSAHHDYAATIMKLLHSKNIAYDELSRTINMAKWNEFLADLLASRRIARAEYDLWHLKFAVKLFAPSLEFLMGCAATAGLVPCEIRPAQGQYLDGDQQLSELYRIVNLERS